MATSVANDFPLATANYYQDHESGPQDHGVDTEAGASGDSSSGVYLSQEGLVAIIVVACVIALVGIGAAVLFYIAKKREWKMRETIRRSARKVVNALTPRRTEFPRDIRETMGRSGRGERGHRLSDNVPPTPRLRPEDIEKGLSVQISAEHSKKSKKNWTRR